MREAGRCSGYMPLSGTASGRPLMINSVSRRGHRQILLATFSGPKTALPQLMSPFQATPRRNLRLSGNPIPRTRSPSCRCRELSSVTRASAPRTSSWLATAAPRHRGRRTRHYAKTRKADDQDRDRHWYRCGVHTIRIPASTPATRIAQRQIARTSGRRLWRGLLRIPAGIRGGEVARDLTASLGWPSDCRATARLPRDCGVPEG